MVLYNFCLNLSNLCMQLFLCKLHQYSNILAHFFDYFRNALSTSCTTIPLLESLTRETFESFQMPNARDGILSLTAMNVVVPCRSIRSFTIAGLEGVLILCVIISSKVIVKTSHEAQSALNSGLESALLTNWVTLSQDGSQCPGLWLRKYRHLSNAVYT